MSCPSTPSRHSPPSWTPPPTYPWTSTLASAHPVPGLHQVPSQPVPYYPQPVPSRTTTFSYPRDPLLPLAPRQKRLFHHNHHPHPLIQNAFRRIQMDSRTKHGNPLHPSQLDDIFNRFLQTWFPQPQLSSPGNHDHIRRLLRGQ